MSWTKREATATLQRMVEARHLEMGQAIARLREAKGWSQETLAHEAGTSTRTVSRLENGLHEGRGSTMRHVAEALDVPLEVLLQVGDQLLTDQAIPRAERIEMKLDLILAHLGISPLETPEDVVDEAVGDRRRRSKQQRADENEPPRKTKRRAS